MTSKNIGIFPDGSVRQIVVGEHSLVYLDPAADKSEYGQMMVYLKLLADAHQVRVSRLDEEMKRVAVMDARGGTHYIEFRTMDRLAADPYKFVEFQAVENDTHATVTAKGRYWLEQWQKRRREYTPT